MDLQTISGGAIGTVLALVFLFSFYFWSRYEEARSYIEMVLNGTINDEDHFEVFNRKCGLCETRERFPYGGIAALQVLTFWKDLEVARFHGLEREEDLLAVSLFWHERKQDIQGSLKEQFPELFEKGGLLTSAFELALFNNLVEHFVSENLKVIHEKLEKLGHTGFTAPVCERKET